MMSLQVKVLGLVLLGVSLQAGAQSYAGFGVGYAENSVACGKGNNCSAKRFGGVIYAGVPLPEALQLDLGVAKVSSFEAGLVSFGTKSSNTPVFTTSGPANNPVITRTDNKSFYDAQGFFGAVTAKGSVITDDLVLVGRLGLAYVSSSVAKTVAGVSVGNETSNRLAPYLGLGVELTLMEGLVASTRLDVTRYGVSNLNGNALLLSAGLAYSY